MNQAERYINDVLEGNIVVGELARLAVERHVEDLKRDDWQWEFSQEAADHAIKCVKILRHTKGREFARRRFMLQDWQAFVLTALFGWVHKENGYRRFRKCYIETAKKSGKSEFAAAVMLYGFLFDGEYGAQCHSAATKRDQAMYVFNPAKTMIKFLGEDFPEIKRMVKNLKQRLYCAETESYISPLSSDYNSLDGVDSHFSIVDEYHAHKNSGLNDNLENSTVNRQNSMHFIITTAGFLLDGPCHMFRNDVVIPVLEGKKEAERLFGMIFTLDEDDDWNDPEVWAKSNPGINVGVPSLDNLLPLYQKAKNLGGTAETDFKTKNLNVWVQTHDVWIPDDLWMLHSDPLDLEELKGKNCIMGLDLGQTRDITSAALLFDPNQFDDGLWRVLSFNWVCEKAAKDNYDRGGNYYKLIDSGHLEVTPGNVTDYNYIKQRIKELYELYNLVRIDYDPHNASHLASELEMEGFSMYKFSQFFANMNAPTKKLEEIVHAELLRHGGNPVLRWMNGNVELKRNSDGYIKIDKKNEHKKVDGMVALVMAIGGLLTYWSEDSVYNHRDLRVIG